MTKPILPGQPLHDAVSTNPCNINLLKNALQRGYHPNSINNFHLTPLHILVKGECHQSQVDAIKLLVQKGANCSLPMQTHAATRPCDIVYMRGLMGHPVKNLGNHLWPKDSEFQMSYFVAQSDAAHALCAQMMQEIDAQCRGYSRWSRWRPWFRAADRHAAVLALEQSLKRIKHQSAQAVHHLFPECETSFPGGANPLHTLHELQQAVQTARHSVRLESCGPRGIQSSDWYQRNKQMDDHLTHELHRIQLMTHPEAAKMHCIEVIRREIREYESQRAWFWNKPDPSRHKILTQLKADIELWQGEPTTPGAHSMTFSSMQASLLVHMKTITRDNCGWRGPRFSRLRNHLHTALQEVEYFNKVYAHQNKLRPQKL